jgi:hypothetical protein
MTEEAKQWALRRHSKPTFTHLPDSLHIVATMAQRHRGIQKKSYPKRIPRGPAKAQGSKAKPTSRVSAT